MMVKKIEPMKSYFVFANVGDVFVAKSKNTSESDAKASTFIKVPNCEYQSATVNAVELATGNPAVFDNEDVIDLYPHAYMVLAD